ncbi:hypothetical protein WAK64_10580 [Bacillus spongiae]|uniref:DUF4383 domain-containing protein n=1 Tax=Bacillus spongiae TaxID=2683610 RepID=A0ABU8HDR6_9BACI
MNSTVRISRIVSIYYLITGLGFSLSSDYYVTMVAHTSSDPVLINLSGMVHFFIGMTILVHHFKWKKPLQIAVSLSGVFFLLKGVFLIVLPELTLQTGNNPAQSPWIMSISFIGVGLLVGYFAYFRKYEDK